MKDVVAGCLALFMLLVIWLTAVGAAVGVFALKVWLIVIILQYMGVI